MKKCLGIRAFWALAGLFISAGLSTAADEQLKPIAVSQSKARGSEEFQVTATTDEGVWIGIRSIWAPARAAEEDRGFVQASGSTIDRVVTDVRNGLFFGYRLTAKALPGDQVRIEVGPLPANFRAAASLDEGCPLCPSFTPLSAALVRYPKPQVVRAGADITFELLRNPKTGETLSDFLRVKVQDKPAASPTSERFKVDLTLRRDESNPQTLLADFHITDLLTGSESVKALIPLERPEDSAQFRFGGLSAKKLPFDARLEVRVSPSAGKVTYTIEVREGQELIHAERVTVPYPTR
jgi:hypothetical protein